MVVCNLFVRQVDTEEGSSLADQSDRKVKY